MSKIRVVHYLNQFFGQIGGEDKADIGPMLKEGVVGPGMALQGQLGENIEIVATVICGDSYFNENIEEVSKEVVDLIASQNPDMVICGPAFNAARYGVACGAVAKAVFDKLSIPVVGGMYQENPGVEMYSKFGYFFKASDSARGMGQAVNGMANIAKKLIQNTELNPETDGYYERGIRKNYFAQKRGSMRAVDMLVAKLKGEDFKTEYPMPNFDRVAPNQPITDLSKAKIALVTSGGIVPKGNPDRIESSSASKFGKYDISQFNNLTDITHETAHGGYDPVYANEDSDRVLPVDVLRELEAQGEIGSLHQYFYTTVGNGTSVANAKAFAKNIGEELVKDGVDAVILTST